MFHASAHGKMANIMLFPILAQFTLGAYLKLHIHQDTWFRSRAVNLHGWLGASYPMFGWIQILFGTMVLGDYCRGGHLGQCLYANLTISKSFFISPPFQELITSWYAKTTETTPLPLIHCQGSSFVAYGVLMSILLMAGADWSRRQGKSPEWWDSWIIMLWVRTRASFE